MSRDQIRQFAERMKEQNLRESQQRELQLLRARTLANRAPSFWKEFTIAMAGAVDQFKSDMGNPVQWDDLSVSSPKLNELVVSKHQSPYLNAVLKIDVQTGWIQGSFKRAVGRPSEAPLDTHTLQIDLKVGSDDSLFGVFEKKPYAAVEDLAGAVLIAFFTGRDGALVSF